MIPFYLYLFIFCISYFTYILTYITYIHKLEASGVRLPEEVVRANVNNSTSTATKQQLTNVDKDHMKEFKNIKELDVGGHRLVVLFYYILVWFGLVWFGLI